MTVSQIKFVGDFKYKKRNAEKKINVLTGYPNKLFTNYA